MKNKEIKFYIDGNEVLAKENESIWQVSKRKGTILPHLCHSDEIGYRPDGNCRACMVEIDGENVLAASCIRKPTNGMKVNTKSLKAKNARKTVFELLASEQPDRNKHPDPESNFWKWSDQIKIINNKFPKLKNIDVDNSHTAMHVNLDACINCNLCVRACSCLLYTSPSPRDRG